MAAAFSVRISEGMARHLVEMYAKGAVAAIQEGDLQPGLVELGAADKVKLAQRVARLTAPMADYNTALANRVHDLVKGMVDEGKSPGEIANALRKSVPDFLNGEPISIQRPGKSRFTATPKQYAEMLARTMPNDIRNEGYIQKMKEMGVADGWIWDGIIDGSTCEKCKKEIRDRRVRSWDEPRPPQASHPGGCRCRPVAHIDKAKKEELKKRVAELKAQAEAEKTAGLGPELAIGPDNLAGGPSVQAKGAEKLAEPALEKAILDGVQKENELFSKYMNAPDGPEKTAIYSELTTLNADNSKLKQALADLRSGKTTPAMPKVTPSSPIISAPGPKLQKAPNIMSIDPKMEVKLDQKLDLINMHRDGVIKFNSIIDDELAKPSPDKNLIYYYADQANNDWKNADRIYRDANSLNTQIVSMGGADKSDKLNLVSPIKPKYTPDEVRMTIEAKTTGAVVSDWKVWQESLAEGERSALEDYTSTAHYQVNKYLRELPAGESIGEHMDQIVKLDSAIDKSKLKHQVVYRGINGEAGIDDLFARGVGTIISDPAYVSTSRLEAMAEAYAGKWGKNGILMEIHIPEGASGAYLEPITAVGHEEEILLPRNSKFGIISSTRSEKGYLKTVVELIL